jgi:hypothetical protein
VRQGASEFPRWPSLSWSLGEIVCSTIQKKIDFEYDTVSWSCPVNYYTSHHLEVHVKTLTSRMVYHFRCYFLSTTGNGGPRYLSDDRLIVSGVIFALLRTKYGSHRLRQMQQWQGRCGERPLLSASSSYATWRPVPVSVP